MAFPPFTKKRAHWQWSTNLLKYLFKRNGLLAHPAAQAGVFFRTGDSVDRPDAQVHFAPAASEADSKGNLKTPAGHHRDRLPPAT